MMQSKYIFAITGGSGVGKTTVSDIFRENGVYVIDADIVSREVVEAGSECLKEITDYFSCEVLNDDKSLDRHKLAEIVFSSKEKLEALNKIIFKYITKRICELINKSDSVLIGIDGATIFESGIDKMCKKKIGVLSEYDKRVKRLQNRDKISEKLIKKRICSQKIDTFYIENCDYLIYNNNGLDYLHERIKEVVSKLEEERKRES